MKTFKNFITEARVVPLQAEKYEAAILLGFALNKNKNADLKKLSNDIGISPSDIEYISKNPEMINIGKLIAKKLKLKGTLKHVGRMKDVSLTDFWVSSGGKNKTPKTDFIVGSNNISLKMGKGQLMSGGRNETLATFYGAVKSMKTIGDVKELEAMLKKMAVSSKTKVKKNVGSIIKTGGDEKIKEINLAHKRITQKFNEFFANNVEFRRGFVYEAMAGELKFGKGSPARANYILVAQPNGNVSKYQKIKDASYLDYIASKAVPQVRFKSISDKSRGVKTGFYRYYSVLQITTKESQERFDRGEILMEGVLDIFYKSWNKFWNIVLGVFKKGTKYILDWFGLTPKVSFNNNILF